jgi:hypothetical protein
MDAIALDQVTYDYMTSRLGYPVGKVGAGPGVVSKATLAEMARFGTVGN